MKEVKDIKVDKDFLKKVLEAHTDIANEVALLRLRLSKLETPSDQLIPNPPAGKLINFQIKLAIDQEDINQTQLQQFQQEFLSLLTRHRVQRLSGNFINPNA